MLTINTIHTSANQYCSELYHHIAEIMATKTEFDQAITVHDVCLVATTRAHEIHAPLTFLDIPWLYFTPVQRLVFYRIPHLSRSQFLENIIPNLQRSLSLTLERFPILAGNLVIFTDSALPEVCCKNGDGVTLISSESNSVDFNSLVHSEERDCADFYPLIPELRPSSNSDDEVISSSTPVLGLQVTLFPDNGLCIGITNNHCVGDARSIFSFMKTWSIISKDTEVVESHLPISVFDKNLIKDSMGFARVMFDQWRNFVTKSKQSPAGFAPGTEPVNKVRKSFVISAKDVEKLKKSASGENSVRVSTFTVVCSYVWTCLVKSRLLLANNQDQDGDDDDDDDDEHFAFAADCRERTDPPIPGNYFGNSLVCCLASAKGSELAEERGFEKATESVGKTIHQKFLHKDAVFDGIDTFMVDIMKLNWDKVMSVAGSPRYSYYELDFGWGNPEKFEFISIDQSGAVSLSGCRDCDKGVEIGLALTKPRMDAFTSVFIQGLIKCA